jgi:hypothetical protein
VSSNSLVAKSSDIAEGEFIQIKYSPMVKKGDIFFWNLTSPYTGDWSHSNFYKNGSIVKLEIIRDLQSFKINPFQEDDGSIYHSFFKLLFDQYEWDYTEWDDPTHWFIYPTEIEFTNGSLMNLCDFYWLYAISDDFLFQDELNRTFSIEIKHENVFYEGIIYYDSYNSQRKIKSIIDRDLGIMKSIHIEETRINTSIDDYRNVETNISIQLINSTPSFIEIKTRSNVDKDSALQFSSYIFGFSLGLIIIISVIIRKRN